MAVKKTSAPKPATTKETIAVKKESRPRITNDLIEGDGLPFFKHILVYFHTRAQDEAKGQGKNEVMAILEMKISANLLPPLRTLVLNFTRHQQIPNTDLALDMNNKVWSLTRYPQVFWTLCLYRSLGLPVDDIRRHANLLLPQFRYTRQDIILFLYFFFCIPDRHTGQHETILRFRNTLRDLTSYSPFLSAISYALDQGEIPYHTYRALHLPLSPRRLKTHLESTLEMLAIDGEHAVRQKNYAQARQINQIMHMVTRLRNDIIADAPKNDNNDVYFTPRFLPEPDLLKDAT